MVCSPALWKPRAKRNTHSPRSYLLTGCSSTSLLLAFICFGARVTLKDHHNIATTWLINTPSLSLISGGVGQDNHEHLQNGHLTKSHVSLSLCLKAKVSDRFSLSLGHNLRITQST